MILFGIKGVVLPNACRTREKGEVEDGRVRPETIVEGDLLVSAMGSTSTLRQRRSVKMCRRYGAGGEDDDGAVLWRRYFPSLAAPLT